MADHETNPAQADGADALQTAGRETLDQLAGTQSPDDATGGTTQDDPAAPGDQPMVTDGLQVDTDDELHRDPSRLAEEG